MDGKIITVDGREIQGIVKVEESWDIKQEQRSRLEELNIKVVLTLAGGETMSFTAVWIIETAGYRHYETVRGQR